MGISAASLMGVDPADLVLAKPSKPRSRGRAAGAASKRSAAGDPGGARQAVNSSSTKMTFAERTLAMWQARAMHALSAEDARQIGEVVLGFFRVLREWAAQHTDSEVLTP